MQTKRRIVLVPDAVDWILGTWAKEIAKWNTSTYDFVIFPVGEIRENPALFRSVLEKADAVHCLTQWGFSEVRQHILSAHCEHLELISTVHHIVKISQVEDCISADKIMVVCQKYLHELIAYGVPKDKLFLVYNGVDADRLIPKDRAVARRDFHIPDSAFVIGFSGKATSDHDGRKGIDIFCDVVSRLPERLTSDIHVVVTGPGWERLRYERAFARVQLHHFPFLPTETMPDFYNALNVYLVTARVEGGPVPLLEAMSCGTPVVTTHVGTALDFVQHAFNGLVIPLDDVEAAVRAVEWIHRDNQFASKLGAQGRETVLQHLQWRNTAVKICNLYGPSLSSHRFARADEESRSWNQLTIELIQRDSARWQRRAALQLSANVAQAPDRARTRVLRRLWSEMRRRLGSRYPAS